MMKKVLLSLLILLLLFINVCAEEPDVKFPDVVDDYKYYLLVGKEYISAGLIEYTLAFSDSPVYIRRTGNTHYLKSTGSIFYYTLTYDGDWSLIKYHTNEIYWGSISSNVSLYYYYHNYDIYYHSTSDIQGLIQKTKLFQYYENQRNLRNYFTGWFNNVLSFKGFTLNYFIVLLSVFCLVIFIKRFFYRLITS